MFPVPISHYKTNRRSTGVIIIDASCLGFHRYNFLVFIRFDNALSLKLINDHPSMRIIHRKVSLILSWQHLSCIYIADLLDYGVIGEEGKDLGEDVEDQIGLDDINETKL
ncbi:hypothetical protein LXL04_026113 [Taraxacum kok-saghyz]